MLFRFPGLAARTTGTLKEQDLTRRRWGWFVSILCHGVAIVAIMSVDRPFDPMTKDLFQWEVLLVNTSATIEDLGSPPIPTDSVTRRHMDPSTQPVRKPIHATRSTVRRIVSHDEVGIDHSQPLLSNAESDDPLSRVPSAEVSHNTPITPAEVPEQNFSEQPSVMTQTAKMQSAVGSQVEPVSALEAQSQQVGTPVIDTPPTATVGPQDPTVQTSVPRQAIQPDYAHADRRSTFEGTLHSSYGWLKEALTEKIGRMKHYPKLAAERRWEGRVIVRGVITGAGELKDLVILESSGYEALDNDAIALLRRISPITLKHPLGQEQVSLRIPIHYSLQ
ncbi:MAG: energy transducer TonB [Nitrospira sp.]|nr:energy transducer TonB [Nitrospira sp.]